MTLKHLTEEILTLGFTRSSVEQAANLKKGKLTEITKDRVAIKEPIFWKMVEFLEDSKNTIENILQKVEEEGFEEDRHFCVYEFVFPNGKKYYGHTRCIQDRWSNNGEGYREQYVYEAIQEFGWDNIQKRVVIDGVDRTSASTIERSMIQGTRSNEEEFGYNKK